MAPNYQFGALIDLHLHLDGSLSLASARELAAMQGMPALTDTELAQRMTVGADCRSLNDFLAKFDYSCSLLQTTASITRAVSNLIHELRDQGLIYAEIRFAPQLFMARGLTMAQVVEAAITGLDDSVMPARLILCCMRGPLADVGEANMATIDAAHRYLGQGVVAADLAGAEALYPTTDYGDVFARARALGVPFTIHAGEAEGIITAAESIRAAIEFGARRIGHGILAYRDPATMRLIASKGIGLTFCPTSNLCTQVFSRIQDYPLRAMLSAGIKFCISTDDMTVAGVSLSHEYEMLRHTFNISSQTCAQLLLNAADMSFAPESMKQTMRHKIIQHYGPTN